MVSDSLLLALEERRRQALLAGDLPALQALLAPDLSYVHSTGARDTRESYLAKLAGGSLQYLTLNFADPQVQLLAQAGVVTARMAAMVSKDGQRKSVASLFMTVWACDADGVWRLHAHQGTPLPTA
jgi:uncharacterized protein (TIGR02246 family)